MDLAQLQYFPLALPHFSLLIGIFLVLVAWIEVQALRLAYMRIGLGPRAALLLLLASLGGSYLNIPVARLAGHQIVSGQEVPFFGMHYVIPVVFEWPDTIVAVNVGGAVIPGLLSLYLLLRYGFAIFLPSPVWPWCATCLPSPFRAWELPSRCSCRRCRRQSSRCCCRAGRRCRLLTSAAVSAR